MPTVPKRGTQQPEDNTADIQGLAHNMAPSTAIAVVSTHARTYTASKKKNPDDKHFLLRRRMLAGVKGAVALAARRAAISSGSNVL